MLSRPLPTSCQTWTASVASSLEPGHFLQQNHYPGATHDGCRLLVQSRFRAALFFWGFVLLFSVFAVASVFCTVSFGQPASTCPTANHATTRFRMPDDKAFAIEAFAVGGWKTEYYADRGPRLHFRLCNVPKGVEEVDLLTYTSISEQEPGRSELKSSQLHVKQVLEGNSMKLWFNCFQLNCSNPPVIFRTKTKTQVRAWITTIEEDSFVGGNSASRGHGKSRGGRLNRARTQGSSTSSTSNAVSSGASMSGYCWLKPSDTKVWCSFANNVFSVSSTPGGPVTQSWNLASTPAPRAQVHTSHVTLSAANNWQSTAVYKLQVGFHGEQQFVCHIKSSVPAGFKTRSPWRSPFFVVKSCNRHVASKAGTCWWL